MNENEETIEENYFECLYCGLTFDSEEARDNHTFEKHLRQVEEKLSQIRNISESKENKETIEGWKEKMKKKLLLKISTENPRLLREMVSSPHSDEMLEHECQMELLRMALKTDQLDSLSAMYIQSPHFAELYEAQKKKHEDATDQSEVVFEIPNAEHHENLSQDDRHKMEMVKVLHALTRHKKEVN